MKLRLRQARGSPQQILILRHGLKVAGGPELEDIVISASRLFFLLTFPVPPASSNASFAAAQRGGDPLI
jgi:hypothetical protein